MVLLLENLRSDIADLRPDLVNTIVIMRPSTDGCWKELTVTQSKKFARSCDHLDSQKNHPINIKYNFCRGENTWPTQNC
jgi:hypothetical protein